MLIKCRQRISSLNMYEGPSGTSFRTTSHTHVKYSQYLYTLLKHSHINNWKIIHSHTTKTLSHIQVKWSYIHYWNALIHTSEWKALTHYWNTLTHTTETLSYTLLKGSHTHYWNALIHTTETLSHTIPKWSHTLYWNTLTHYTVNNFCKFTAEFQQY